MRSALLVTMIVVNLVVFCELLYLLYLTAKEASERD